MKKVVKHTPGPFEVQNPLGDDEGLWIVQAGLKAYEWSTIAIVCRDEDRGGKHFITKAEQKANADLFAASDDMLEALRELSNALDDVLCNSGTPGFDSGRLGRAQDTARSAIAKATGASS